MSERACAVCPTLRDGDPRHYQRAHVCDPCRRHLARMLTEVATGFAELAEHLERGAGHGGPLVRGGEVEAALPFRVDVWDLLGVVRLEVVRDVHGDQTGYVSAATTLHLWCRDWCATRALGEVGPGLAVPDMAAWLADRLEWACDEHAAIADFAVELCDLWRAVRRYVADREPRPEPCVGVPCRRCDFKTLARLADGSGDIECQNLACRTIYRPDEYTRWTKMLAASVR